MDVRPGNLTWNPQNWMFYKGGCLLFQGGIFRSQSLASSPLLFLVTQMVLPTERLKHMYSLRAAWVSGVSTISSEQSVWRFR